MSQQAYGGDCLSRTQCHEWYQRFKSGGTSIEDDPKSGRSSTSVDDDHVQKVLAVIRQNRRLTVREVAAEVTICKSSCHLILTQKRKVRRAAAKCAASAVASLLIHEFLTKHKTTVVPQSLYSPDLAPTDIFLLPKWKSPLKGRRFQTVEETQDNSIRDLRAVPQNTFQDAFQKWKKRWKRGIGSGGEYFESDKFD